jgi:dihydrolipoamide dehydrogenase
VSEISCDVAIIGAGTAGLAAERAARKAGVSTVVIDDRFAGTTCATVGCMPSKLLIAAANAAHNVRKASIFGIRAPAPVIDGYAVMDRLRKERSAFVTDTLKVIEQLPHCIKGRARFGGQTTLAIDDGRKVLAKAVVVATGARPGVPKMFEALGELVHTNETIFELRSLPRSIAVVGAGPLGLELAQAFSRLGVDTGVFEKSEHIAGLRDPDVAKELRSILSAEFPVHSGVTFDVTREGQGARLSWSGSSTGSRSFECVLVATGRPPELENLNLSSTGVAIDERGVPRFDSATLQCGNAPIFVAGDADRERPVLHEASIQGTIAGKNAASFPDVHRSKRPVSLSIVFTDPPLATIGAPPADSAIVGAGSYAGQGRAKVEACTAGIVKIYADRGTGRLTGAVLLGPAMDHVAHLIAWAIEHGETAGRMLELPIYHPTFEEGLKQPLRQICESVGAELGHLDTFGPAGG